ncbi:hypothetical protein ACTOWA_00030 [Herbaspirillum seropedicae]|uniref:hypothetical protein n=1 Tax=Herbaspirillum seropedicae TaxID=964 RepID=UPI002857AB94|nr:hypothetical protein [Herbaspirillum seropedicae]MDR6398025.1 hypothetical protein [Herbaspirillum seropedicae]
MSTLGRPRERLIDLLQSPVGLMVARRIDAAHGVPAEQAPEHVKKAAALMLAAVKTMNRDQLEACSAPLNRFFGAVPFSLAIPVVIAIEKIWPHHVETIPAANKRLDVVRKGGLYSETFSSEKMQNMLKAVMEVMETQ